jgi:hypothetical protein
MIVAPSADLDMAVRAIVFSAVGTAGQRCTSLRRLIVHESIRRSGGAAGEGLCQPAGRRPAQGRHAGRPADRRGRARPDEAALDRRGPTAARCMAARRWPTVAGGAYVAPAIGRDAGQTEIVREETFAPILYVMAMTTLDEAIAMQNDVPQGLSSCIFTLNLREAETFLSAVASDCGIANVNIGPSGAEIGGAFGGEKETGGGRESDAGYIGRVEGLHAPREREVPHDPQHQIELFAHLKELLALPLAQGRDRVRHLSAGFPNAELAVNRDERRFWSDDGNFSGADENVTGWQQLAKAVLAAYGDRIVPLQGEAEIAPGLTIMPLPGHTPGHCGWRLESDGQVLIHVGDIVHAPALQIPDPEIGIGFDIDMDAARETRKRLLDRLASEDALFTGGHLLQPAFARVKRSRSGYELVQA